MALRWLNWLEQPTKRPARDSHRRAAARRRRPLVEQLEARDLLSTLPAGFSETRITGGYPVAQDFAPDGHLFVAHKSGALTLVEPDGTPLATPFYSVAVDGYRDRGLTGVVVDPDYETNHYVYIYYTAAVPSNPDVAENGAVNKLVRLTASATNHEVANPASAVVILDNIPSPTGIHQGGFLHFGADGMLYIGIGEGDVAPNSQDLSNLYGKILRLDVSNTSTSNPYVIPPDNPFAGQAGKRAEIWASGFRNPYSGNIDPLTGLIYVNDVGNVEWEEVNQLSRGGNYGWPLAEGATTNPTLVSPIYAYNHNGGGAAVVGGAFYRGSSFPGEYQGKYFFADLVQGEIRVLDPATHQATVFATNVPYPTDTDFSPDGDLFYTTVEQFAAAVYKVEYTSTGNRAPSAVATADVLSGLAPLTVHFSGAASTDPDGDQLFYAWDFGDGTTATGISATHPYTVNGPYSAVLTVSDRPAGGLSSTATLAITVGNRSPLPVIDLPLATDTYQAGQTILFAGSATDPEDGSLPSSALRWSFQFGHNTHFHDFIAPVEGAASGSFTIDRFGETAPDQYYRIFLTATDAGGLTTTVYRDLHPQLSAVHAGEQYRGCGAERRFATWRVSLCHDRCGGHEQDDRGSAGAGRCGAAICLHRLVGWRRSRARDHYACGRYYVHGSVSNRPLGGGICLVGSVSTAAEQTAVLCGHGHERRHAAVEFLRTEPDQPGGLFRRRERRGRRLDAGAGAVSAAGRS